MARGPDHAAAASAEATNNMDRQPMRAEASRRQDAPGTSTTRDQSKVCSDSPDARASEATFDPAVETMTIVLPVADNP